MTHNTSMYFNTNKNKLFEQLHTHTHKVDHYITALHTLNLENLLYSNAWLFICHMDLGETRVGCLLSS